MVLFRTFSIHGTLQMQKFFIVKKVYLDFFLNVLQNGYFRNFSLKGSLRNQNLLFYGITAKTPFWNLYFCVCRLPSLVTNILQYIYFCVEQKKFSYTCLEWHEVELTTTVFGWIITLTFRPWKRTAWTIYKTSPICVPWRKENETIGVNKWRQNSYGCAWLRHLACF